MALPSNLHIDKTAATLKILGMAALVQKAKCTNTTNTFLTQIYVSNVCFPFSPAVSHLKAKSLSFRNVDLL